MSFLRSHAWWLLLSTACGGMAVWRLMDDPQQQPLLAATVRLAMLTTLLALPLGTVLALLLERTDVVGGRLARRLLPAMLLVPVTLQAAAWDAGFGGRGWYTVVREMVAAPWLAGWAAAVWVHAMVAVPWVTVILSASLRTIDPGLEEQALLSGSGLRVIARVTLPRMLGGLACAALWVGVSTATEMTITDLYRVRTYAEELYTGFALGDDLATAWRSALPGILAGAALLITTVGVIRAIAPAVRSPLRAPLRFRLGRGQPWAAGTLLFLGLLVIGVPVGSLCYKAGLTYRSSGDGIQAVWHAWYGLGLVLRSFGTYRVELGWTMLIAACSASLAMLAAFPLAWTGRRGGLWAWPATLAAAVGVATPAPLIGLGVIWLLDRSSPAVCIWLYDRTVLPPVLAISVRLLAPALLLCWLLLTSLSRDLLDSASVLGAGAFRRLWHVVVPARRSGLATVWFVLAALAAGDLACSILVVPPGVTTVPIRMFGLMHAGVDDQVAGLALAMLILVAVAATTIQWTGIRRAWWGG
jgi:iron(III) transport system permease protein